MEKFGANTGNGNGKKPGTFTGKDDPRNGHGPPKGQGGRPPDWFKRKMATLASRRDVLRYLKRCLTHPADAETFLKAWKEAADRGFGRSTQKQELSGPEGGPIPYEHVDSPREHIERELARIAARRAAVSSTS